LRRLRITPFVQVAAIKKIADESRNDWVNDYTGSPRIEGNLEISRSRDGIFIGGDPVALRSLARLLNRIANVDQESLAAQPDGERFHVHLHTRDVEGFNSPTRFSEETELCRLDAKGTGDLPAKYRALGKGKRKKSKGVESKSAEERKRRARRDKGSNH
jgi:hypothetical protein